MHNADQSMSTAPAAYRERLSPSLWVLVSAAVCAPMVAIVFAPLDGTIALAIGLGVGVVIVAALIAAAPTIELADGVLRVGRARIPVTDLGAPEALEAEAARAARGPELRGDDWHLLRGGVDGVVRVPVTDADDPTTHWVFSSRTPDRVAAVITRAQRGR